jgi:hypothetical protein
MKKRVLIQLSCAIALSSTVKAQYNIPENKIWAFSQNYGLDFTTSPPTPIYTSMHTGEGSASVASKEGALLFYSDGNDVFNGQGNLMPNGSLITGIAAATNSTTQAALIVPVPGSAKRYYLFSLPSISALKGFNCNVVDMTLDNGSGDIDLTFPLRSLSIHDSLSEKMIAIAGCNNNVWVVMHDRSNNFLSFEATAAGVDTIPVVSTLPNATGFGAGVMKANSTGDKIISSELETARLDLFDFDITTGHVSNHRIVDSGLLSYGCAFSPDGTKVYASHNTVLMQYNLNDVYPALSKVNLGTHSSFDIRLAPDGKLYFPDNNLGFTGAYLDCVRYPDVLGVGCTIDSDVVFFSNNSFPIVDFPNQVVTAKEISQSVAINRVVLDSMLCSDNTVNFALQAAPGFSGYSWDNGATTASRNIQQAGNYYVTYNTVCGQRTDTFKIRSHVADLSIVNNNGILSTTNVYSGYQWYLGDTAISGANNASLTTTGDGVYSVVVRNLYGCVDSSSYALGTGGNGTAINGPKSLASKILVYPNPATDRIYIKSPVAFSASFVSVEGKQMFVSKDKAISLKTLAPGLYFININDENGTLIKVEKFVKMQ